MPLLFYPFSGVAGVKCWLLPFLEVVVEWCNSGIVHGIYSANLRGFGTGQAEGVWRSCRLHPFLSLGR